MFPSSLRRLSGFTLVELLIAMVILALGLLGIGALQLLSIKDSQDAYSYSQAMALTYEMADRIHANAAAWNAGTLPAAASNCSNNCNSVANSCNAATMASYDYCVWAGKGKTQLGPSASTTISISPVLGSSVCTGTSSMRCLTMNWVNGHQSNAKFELEMQP